ncbi:hypothetical protein QUG98_05385 [Curtobacterium sp. RHCJP20]|uniref:Uncharacterized protein n=1 Tax=Curtobacterium subtropicum TaxID=3055138 RepID=A0ABT7TEU4_9MICO|nr:hypothetical protein [Curtobacterium subtropicum]MDM7887884.1 hypothetical protein [Curtobacterium subtropicum]
MVRAAEVIGVGFDRYDWRARLVPGIAAVLPAVTVVVSIGVETHVVTSLASSAVLLAVGGFLLAIAVGDAGRSCEPALWASWGGRPTTQLLRLRDQAPNAAQREGWRAAVSKVTGIDLFSSRRESLNPSDADEVIETATDQLRYLSRAGENSALADANAEYGAQRNIWGARRFGRGIAVVSLVALWVTALFGQEVLPISAVALVGGNIAIVVVGLWWFIFPSADRVRSAGFRYAYQLFDATVRASKSSKS